MAGPILPGSRTGYRTTTSAFKWIILIVVLGTVAMVWVFWTAVKDADSIYEKAGYTQPHRLIDSQKRIKGQRNCGFKPSELCFVDGSRGTALFG